MDGAYEELTSRARDANPEAALHRMRESMLGLRDQIERVRTAEFGAADPSGGVSAVVTGDGALRRVDISARALRDLPGDALGAACVAAIQAARLRLARGLQEQLAADPPPDPPPAEPLPAGSVPAGSAAAGSAAAGGRGDPAQDEQRGLAVELSPVAFAGLRDQIAVALAAAAEHAQEAPAQAYTGSAADGYVTATVSGAGELRSIDIHLLARRRLDNLALGEAAVAAVQAAEQQATDRQPALLAGLEIDDSPVSDFVDDPTSSVPKLEY